jgi:UDP-3-O-[3-hydroxymyristoyl] glucosamine N-acyltransferase
MQITLLEVANLVQGEMIGDGTILISALSSLDNVTEGSLVFAEGNHNLKIAAASAAGAVLVGDYVTDLNKPMIRVSEPFAAFIMLLKHFYPARRSPPGIHPTAVVADDVVLGDDVVIGPYVVVEPGCKIGNRCVIKSHVHIGHDVTIGEDTILHPQVCIYENCQLGARVIIHASTVIGSDGFGYFFKDGEHVKVPHVGLVVIGNDVEIGANTVIDRATVGATRIGDGTKIDNLVQIAHSVQLGKHNILCAFTGIAGSSKSGNHVIFAANVGVSDHVTIDDGVILGARTGVPPRKHLKQGNVYLGSPARVKDKAIEFELASTRIPMMRKNLLALTEKVKRLSERMARLDLEKEDS